ncbi:MAG: phosphotransferase [Lachnospiraceae bacterium]|nr:phosphotransferase [Lachnospiraceae bacterium]
MNEILKQAQSLYFLKNCTFREVSEHEGGRNSVYVCHIYGADSFVLRISKLEDRTEEDYLAEAEFVHYLAANNAPVSDVVASINGRFVEKVDYEGKRYYVALFGYAEGKLLSENGYRYRNGAPIEEYFYNTGKTLGIIHRLSKVYVPRHKRPDYFDKYNKDYINKLISDEYSELKEAIYKRFSEFETLPKDRESYGTVHFDYSDGNYHVDMRTGNITVFDFDNSMRCWYMFDLANLWIHGEGWCRHESNPKNRMEYMKHYFDTVLDGYRSETDVSEEMLSKLPLFIDMVLIENIVDEFEVCAREGEELDYEDIENAAGCLINSIPYAGVGQ